MKKIIVPILGSEDETKALIKEKLGVEVADPVEKDGIKAFEIDPKDIPEEFQDSLSDEIGRSIAAINLMKLGDSPAESLQNLALAVNYSSELKGAVDAAKAAILAMTFLSAAANWFRVPGVKEIIEMRHKESHDLLKMAHAEIAKHLPGVEVIVAEDIDPGKLN